MLLENVSAAKLKSRLAVFFLLLTASNASAVPVDEPLNILIVEPFLGGSHKQWAEGYQRHSVHKVEILGLSGRHWKWRMHGGAITLARLFNERNLKPDLILASDMLDLNSFLAQTRHLTHAVPIALYFHENQLSYPWSPNDKDRKLKRDLHYAFINFSSALAADHSFFNSQYHLDSFLEALPAFLRIYPDHREMPTIQSISNKSEVLSLGMELLEVPSKQSPQEGPPVILWNHRWEYDKAPEAFFEMLFQLQEEGFPFELVVLGEKYGKAPPIFAKAREALAGRILHWGFVPSREAYLDWLKRAHFLPVTSIQDFFGGSIVEAMSAGVWPILPNRLAYPSHVPQAYRSEVLYDPGELLVRMRSLLSGSMPDRTLPSTWVQSYQWKHMAAIYDARFEKL